MFDIDPTARNITPTRYRHVALSTGRPTLDPDALVEHFTGREAYYRTRYIVARDHDGRSALVEVTRPETDDLFSDTVAARVLATADECVYVTDANVDVGIPSSLAAVADRHADARCVIVEGLYSHVSFLLNPAPIRIHVLDVVPPFPSKLVDQIARVLAVGEDLPPIVLDAHIVDSRAVLAADQPVSPATILFPCRASGLDFPGTEVHYLDERPEKRDWVLLGCERSQRIHAAFYDDRAELVDTCPRRFLAEMQLGVDPETGAERAALTRCCLLQTEIEWRGGAMQVPWGSTLAEVRAALEAIVEHETKVGRFAWAPT